MPRDVEKIITAARPISILSRRRQGNEMRISYAASDGVTNVTAGKGQKEL
jgi:hypothetical protein